MTDAYVNTVQYRVLLSDLNKALPLELLIRAVKLEYPEKLEKLKDIDEEIRIAWTERGFTEEEVDHNGLAELCWDITQLGWSERRRPFEVFPREVIKLIQDGVSPICETYLRQVKLEDYPFAQRYRYADLVRGMNIEYVLLQFLERYAKLREDPGTYGVPIGNFVLSARAPVAVVPGALQHACLSGPKQSEYLGVMLRYDMPLEDVHAALLDFQYHYAEFRLRKNKTSDEVANRLLDPWGNPSMPSTDDHLYQYNQLHPHLAGLYCYDRFVARGGKESKGAQTRAREDTVALYSEAIAPELNSVGKWLKSTGDRVAEIAAQLRGK